MLDGVEVFITAEALTSVFWNVTQEEWISAAKAGTDTLSEDHIFHLVFGYTMLTQVHLCRFNTCKVDHFICVVLQVFKPIQGYCVFAYNVQPGIEIDYATGESKLADGAQQEEQKTATVTPTPSPEPEKQEPVTGSEASQADYILNTNTKKFHYPTCSSVNDMKEKNKQEFFGTRDETIALGYSPCGRCKP